MPSKLCDRNQLYNLSDDGDKKGKNLFKDGVEQIRRQHKYFKVDWGFIEYNTTKSLAGKKCSDVLFTASSSHREDRRPALPSGDEKGRQKVQQDP
jgi:hypothetical protein